MRVYTLPHTFSLAAFFARAFLALFHTSHACSPHSFRRPHYLTLLPLHSFTSSRPHAFTYSRLHFFVSSRHLAYAFTPSLVIH
jgi:hypothetical protein